MYATGINPYSNNRMSRKKKTLEEKWIGIPKAIYTNPFEIETTDLSENDPGSIFYRADDKRIVLKLETIDIIEFCFAVFCVIVLMSWIVIPPILEYNKRIAIYHKEYAEEDGQPTALKPESKERYYRRETLKELKDTASNDTMFFNIILGGHVSAVCTICM